MIDNNLWNSVNFTSEFTIDIPRKTYRNGTMYLHLVLVNDIGVEFEWRNLKREGLTVLQRISLTEYMVPRPASFNLLNENEVSFLPMRIFIIQRNWHLICNFVAGINDTKDTEAGVTLEAKSVFNHFNRLLFGISSRYSTRNGPTHEVIKWFSIDFWNTLLKFSF